MEWIRLGRVYSSDGTAAVAWGRAELVPDAYGSLSSILGETITRCCVWKCEIGVSFAHAPTRARQKNTAHATHRTSLIIPQWPHCKSHDGALVEHVHLSQPPKFSVTRSRRPGSAAQSSVRSHVRSVESPSGVRLAVHRAGPGAAGRELGTYLPASRAISMCGL